MIYIMDKRLNDHGKNWRHVYKTLVLLEYMICCGSEMVVNYARDRIYMIGTLKEFQHVDQQGFDQGGNVRNKSRDIVDLLNDEAALEKARTTKSIPQVLRRGSEAPLTITNKVTVTEEPRRRNSYDELQQMDEETALAMALRESKEMHERQSKSKSRRQSIDPSRVYPNFLDNVSRASLAKSSTSLNNPVMATEGTQQMASLLDLDDEDFGRGSNPEVKESKAQDLFDLYSLNMNHPSHSQSQNQGQNPFTIMSAVPEVNPFDASVDPFSTTTNTQTEHCNVPLPVVPGMAPVNHMSIASNNVGAKPVMPHQLAPQFGYTANQPQGNAEAEDPFAQL